MNKPNELIASNSAAKTSEQAPVGPASAAPASSFAAAAPESRPEIQQPSPKDAVKGPFTQIPPGGTAGAPLLEAKADNAPMSQQQSAAAATEVRAKVV